MRAVFPRYGRMVGVWCVVGLLVVRILPAQACGCGMVIPREGETSVPQERALIRWDGQTEDLIMRLSVQGVARDAAWILPVPSRATVQLAGATLFTELEDLSKPEIQVEWEWLGGGGGGGGAAGGAAVTVLERQTIGPFDVSTLAATDAGALQEWLTTHGYRVPARLDTVLPHYVAHNWEYVAAKLTRKAGDATLGGELDPLWVRFASRELVYPMRASALAQQSVSVYLYVLADHRVTTTHSFGWAEDLYADWIAPDQLSDRPALQALVPRRLFLTKLTEFIHNPARIYDDYHFTFAADDTPYRAVSVQYRTHPLGLLLLGMATFLGGLIEVYKRLWN